MCQVWTSSGERQDLHCAQLASMHDCKGSHAGEQNDAGHAPFRARIVCLVRARLWPRFSISEIKKISEPTEKREIPEISAQIQIEFKNFKIFWHDFTGDRDSSNLPRRHGLRLQPAGRRHGGLSWAARGARGHELKARAAAGWKSWDKMCIWFGV
jgi:hypothetical protein